MKKLTLLASLFFIGVLATNAQDLDVKLGYTYGFEIEKGGLRFDGQYGVTDEIDVAAGLSFFFPEKGTVAGTDYKSNVWMIDFDGHYNFDLGNGLNVYPLTGLNFSTFRSKVGDTSDSTTKFGVNIGGGAQFKFSDPLGAFLELKYILGDADQAVMGVGLTYSLK